MRLYTVSSAQKATKNFHKQLFFNISFFL